MIGGRINIVRTGGGQTAVYYGSGLENSVKAASSGFRFERRGGTGVIVHVEGGMRFERGFEDVWVQREDRGDTSYTQMSDANYDDLTEDINDGGGAGGGQGSVGTMIVPDYANQESINRITVNNGTWTADRSGYVHVGATGSDYDVLRFRIDGKIATYSYLYPTSSNLGTGYILPIMKGQTISIENAVNDIRCYFIPPIIVDAKAPVISADYTNYLASPDFENLDPTPLLVTSGSTWTADRSGYLVCTFLVTATTSQAWGRAFWLVNGHRAADITFTYIAGAGGAGNDARVIAIERGDVITAQWDGGNGTLTVTSRFVPAKFAQTVMPKVAPDFKNFFPSIDTSESTLVIDASGETWTATRDGFLTLGGWTDAGKNLLFTINGIGVLSAASPSYIHHSEVVPIRRGQVLACTAGSGMSVEAYFFKTAFSEVSAPVIEPGGDYHLYEEPVLIRDGNTVRAKRWIDGKPIYRQTFSVGTLNTSSTWGWIDVVNITLTEKFLIKPPDIIGKINNNQYGMHFQWEQNGNTLQIATEVARTWTNVYVTLEYTKTTD
jgi:hypothetical protein